MKNSQTILVFKRLFKITKYEIEIKIAQAYHLNFPGDVALRKEFSQEDYSAAFVKFSKLNI